MTATGHSRWIGPTAARRIGALFALLATLCPSPPVHAQALTVPTDDELVKAYHYLLGRWFVLRQETLDLKAGMKWNQVVHREPGGVEWANPNLDVAYSEAWIGIDEKSCTLVTLPEITNRYYTVQVLNGWGEVTANLNDRNYPKHPFGTFALCLKGAQVTLPAGAERVDLPNRKSRVLMRIELGADPDQARALQKQITMQPTGTPTIEKTIEMRFSNDKLPSVAAFIKNNAILASDPDINEGANEPAMWARALDELAHDPSFRGPLAEVIRRRAIPAFYEAVREPGPVKNGWIHPRLVGNYGKDFQMRSIVNMIGIWANTPEEAVYFGRTDLDGSRTYTQTYPKAALPESKARYFWSVVAVDNVRYRVIRNALDRHLLSKQSKLTPNADGSLTLAFGPTAPAGIPESNWLPTPDGRQYNLTYRFYGPTSDVVSGEYYPPPLVEKKPDSGH